MLLRGYNNYLKFTTTSRFYLINELLIITLQGDSISELIEVISAFNPEMGNNCEKQLKQLISNLQQPYSCPFNSIDDNGFQDINSEHKQFMDLVKEAVAAKRSLRLVMALVTTHIGYANHWQQLLLHIQQVIKDFNTLVKQFKCLNKDDQKILIGKRDQKLEIFIGGSLRIAALGLLGKYSTSIFNIIANVTL